MEISVPTSKRGEVIQGPCDLFGAVQYVYARPIFLELAKLLSKCLSKPFFRKVFNQ